MTLRREQDALRPSILRPDELPLPVPDDLPVLAGVERRPNGTVADSAAARELGRRGGQVRSRRVRFARSLGLSHLDSTAAFAPYRRAAASFRRHQCGAFAAMAGGTLGPAPASMVASAALQLMASRFLFDQASVTGDAATLKMASALANDSRQNLIAAYELAVREAHARRGSAGPADPLAKFMPSAGEIDRLFAAVDVQPTEGST